MQVVIKISEREWKEIVNDKDGIFRGRYFDMIRDGTPLPNGHGDLIDADVLGEKLDRYTEAPYQYALTAFNESPTVIEADAESEGKLCR